MHQSTQCTAVQRPVIGMKWESLTFILARWNWTSTIGRKEGVQGVYMVSLESHDKYESATGAVRAGWMLMRTMCRDECGRLGGGDRLKRSECISDASRF